MKTAAYLFALLFVAGCSAGVSGWNDTPPGDDASATDDGGATSDDAATTKTPSTTKDGGGGGTTTTDSGGGSTTTTKDSGSTTTQDSGGTTANSTDGFQAVRTACINEINKLRASQGHAPYALWETSSIDQCVDEQATYDQKQNSAHDAWMNSVYPTCNGNAQDECLGYGNTVQGIVQCLDDMWNERNQPNCSTCDSCNSTQLTQQVLNCQNTSTCDFYGSHGGECGHYVNMSADYFVEAACGFSTVGSGQDWAVQNFK